jgi:hypothetical protein
VKTALGRRNRSVYLLKRKKANATRLLVSCDDVIAADEGRSKRAVDGKNVSLGINKYWNIFVRDNTHCQRSVAVRCLEFYDGSRSFVSVIC